MTKDKKATPDIQAFKYGLPVDEKNALHKPSPFNCQRCNYPHGNDWLDDGETCPNCKLVN